MRKFNPVPTVLTTNWTILKSITIIISTKVKKGIKAEYIFYNLI